MKTPAQADLQRWSEEVARDPASLAFLPLARAYRRQGLRPAAKQLCIRGLEHYPTHAEAHSLLALLYLEEGDRTKAADEWSMVLRMDPNHFEALRGIGFCYLEQDQLSRARQALEKAALMRPQDAAVQEALKVLGTRQELHAGGAHTNAAPDDMVHGDANGAGLHTPKDASGAETQAVGFDEPWMDTPSGASVTPAAHDPASAADAAPRVENVLQRATPADTGARGGMPFSFAETASAEPTSHQQQHAPPRQQPAQTDTQQAASVQALPADPAELFSSMTASGQLIGVLLLDAQGLVLAGGLDAGAPGSADALGATLGPAISEAARTVSLLSLGSWRGMLLEAGTAVLHVRPVSDDAIVLLAAKRNAPTGWVLRAAGQAGDIAQRFLQEYA